MKALLITVLLLMPTLNFAQKLGVNINICYGSFSNNSLQDLNEKVARSYPVVPKILHNFPSRPYPELEIIGRLKKKFHYGGSLRYFSSGSRVYYEDYSGKMYTDMVLNGYSVLAIFEQQLSKDKDLQISLYGKLGYIYNTLDTSSNIIIEDVSEKEDIKMNSYNFVILPGVSLKYLISKVYIKGNFGYEFNLASDLKLSGFDNYVLIGKYGQEVKANWSGIRISLGIGIAF